MDLEDEDMGVKALWMDQEDDDMGIRAPWMDLESMTWASEPLGWTWRTTIWASD